MIDLPWDFTVIPKYFPRFFEAAMITIQITALGIFFGMILGLVFALMRISKFKILNLPARAYIWLIRGTPLILQLFVVYYGLSTQIRIPSYTSAVMALAIHNGAYIAEIFRGAILSVDRGQTEAAASIGMTSWQTMKRIVLPQAFKQSLPPLGNQFIIALKDSSLASTITVHELMLQSRQLASSNYMMMEMLIIAGIYYIAMTSLLTLIVRKIEYRFSVSDHRV